MKQIIVSEQEAGQRLDKLLHKMMKEAPDNFLYKMLRKKNITLNGKKADGREKVFSGDSLAFFLSDETFEKFAPGLSNRLLGEKKICGSTVRQGKSFAETENAYEAAFRKIGRLEILYEDKEVLIVNKPSGLLSQKAAAKDVSLNEWLIGYLLAEKKIDMGTLRTFSPSICNRLDRNTSGLVICGVSLAGSRKMSELLKERTLHKYYRLLVKGVFNQEAELVGWLLKDETRNKVKVLTQQEYESLPAEKQADYCAIRTKYSALASNGGITLAEAELITGKTHQIRAQLAGTGHPLIGDAKYGSRAFNQIYREKYGVNNQLLHAYRLEFPQMEQPFSQLSGRTVICRMPELYQAILRKG